MRRRITERKAFVFVVCYAARLSKSSSIQIQFHMHITSIYTLASVILISLISFIGVISFAIQEKNIKKYLLFFVSLSAGTLLGGALLHLLPEAVAETGFTLQISLTALAGIVVFFIVL